LGSFCLFVFLFWKHRIMISLESGFPGAKNKS
jgi:hypothetical protein